ncbi:MAG: hypothetical protein HQ559_01290, partial [Lentisphaerae bacterium]|nr:hypothetical protein [Lentisphaerota bacterium]
MNEIPVSRRGFLGAAAGFGAAAFLGSTFRLCAGGSDPGRRKLIVVQFGGGTRCSETIDDPRHRYIPGLWTEMVTAGTLFTNMRVEHRVVHPNSTGSMMTGHWEWDDIDWSRPVAHPTLFEIFRRTRDAPDTSAWAFVYASILAKTGESMATGYGRPYAANVVEPPTIPRSASDRMDALLRAAAADGSPAAERRAARDCAALARSTSSIARGGLRSPAAREFLDREYAVWKGGYGSTSHDAFLTDRAIACMRRFAPDVVAIDYGEIDCAHYGSWSRYVEAIRRTDELTCRVWREVQQLEAYRDNTLLLVLPDHGRELDESGGWGFVHH